MWGPRLSFSWERTAVRSRRDASLADRIREASLSFRPEVRLFGCAEPPQRSEAGASGRTRVLLAAPRRPVFVAGALDYSDLPGEAAVRSHAEPQERERCRGSDLCEEDVITGSAIVLGRGPTVSCSHTRMCVPRCRPASALVSRTGASLYLPLLP